MTKSEAIQTLVSHQDRLVAIRDESVSRDQQAIAECLLALSELSREGDAMNWAEARYESAVREVND